MKLLLALVLAAAAGAAAAQNTNEPQKPTGGRSDWELEQERRSAGDGPLTLPAWPGDADLIEFHVSASSAFRFYIDAKSLSVGADHVVRYTLVARSPSGVTNVSYEGMRCADAMYRVYAYGQDGRWAASGSDWREIDPKPMQRWHYELRTRYLCPGNGVGTIMSAEEGVNALRRGGHPGVTARPGY